MNSIFYIQRLTPKCVPIFIFACFLFFKAIAQPSIADTTAWRVLKVEGKTLYFQNGQKFETPLFHLQYWGMLSTSNKPPYLILSGRDCNNCNAPDALYIHSPGDGPILFEEYPNKFAFPGKMLDRVDSSLLYQARTFIGTVLPDIPEGVIWYQSYKKQGQIIPSVYTVKVVNDKLKRNVQYGNMPDLNETLRLVEINRCIEIPGKEYLSEK